MTSREDVIAELEEELECMLVDAPESLSESARRNVKNEFVGYAKRVLSSLSNAELQNESARQRFMVTTLRDAERRVRGF